MKKSLKLFAAFLALSFVLFSCESGLPVSPVQTDGINNNSYIVTLSSTGNVIQSSDINSEVKEIFTKHNIDISALTYTYNSVMNGFAANLTDAQVISLKTDKNIISIEKDIEFTSIDKVESIESAKSAKLQGQSTPWGINAVGGFVQADANTGVAWIVDTGIDLDHPDLNVDKNLSKTFVTRTPDNTSADDLNGHGTHVAGTIAAINNTIGPVGVCAGAKVIAIKVLSYRGSGLTSQIIAGLDYVGKNLIPGKVNVVNMSLGGSASTTLDNAVKTLALKGAMVVVAAGNNASSATKYSPSRIQAQNVFVVSAFDNRGYFATYSNYSNPPIAYSAPGTSVYSTYKNGQYATMSGTSMAAPHICGILLADNGNINWNGQVIADKDSTPDKKARR